jgi:uncharacterized membrane protein
MYVKGIDVKKLNKLVDELRKRDLWAERHSYSIRIIYNGLIVASLHIYPGFNEAVLRLYGDNTSDRYVQSVVGEVLSQVLEDVKLKVVKIR